MGFTDKDGKPERLPEQGDRVSVMVGPLGVLASKEADRFVIDHDEPTSSIVVNSGETATYEGPNPGIGDRWHFLSVEKDGRKYWVPAHDNQFRKLQDDAGVDDGA